ncbi:hypothetical protein BJX65DRAFT_277649 [Aspergillus insuetus]
MIRNPLSLWWGCSQGRVTSSLPSAMGQPHTLHAVQPLIFPFFNVAPLAKYTEPAVFKLQCSATGLPRTGFLMYLGRNKPRHKKDRIYRARTSQNSPEKYLYAMPQRATPG